MDFTQFLTGTYTESNSSNLVHAEFVQTNFNMATLCLDNYRQSFFQLIYHSV